MVVVMVRKRCRRPSVVDGCAVRPVVRRPRSVQIAPFEGTYTLGTPGLQGQRAPEMHEPT